MKRINMKKIIINIFFLIIVIFMKFGIVSADERAIHTNKYYSEYFPITYFDGKYDVSHFRIYSFFDRTAYSIELNKSVDSSAYYFTDDYKKLGLTEEQLNYIQLIAYYGYDYPTHKNDIRYFMVAQELIYEYLIDELNVFWGDNFFDRVDDLDFSSYKNEILELVNNHSVLPSFNDATFNFLVGEKIELVDDNSVISNYEIVDADGVLVSISDNKLIIGNDYLDVGEYTLQLKKKSYLDSLTYLYYLDDYQKFFTPGKIEEVEFKVKINVESASLNIKKCDKDNLSLGSLKLMGAKYGIYDVDDSLIRMFKIGENGQAVIENLKLGTYKLKEIEPSYGYKLDENIYIIDIEQKSNEFVVYGDAIVKKLEIFKTYDNEKLFDNGCVFDIFKDDKLYKSIVTDKNGYASAMIPYGKYLVKQKSFREGYDNIEFELKIDENSNNVISYRLNSDRIFKDDIAIKNPKTNDDILKNIISLSVTIFSLIVIWIYKIRKNVL